MLARWLIIDGNNLMHSDPTLAPMVRRDFPLARHELARRLDGMRGVLAERITLVFDGTIGGRQTGFEASGIQVFFTSADVSADALIERLAAEAPDREAVLVVSSDRMERHTVEAAGVRSISCRLFLDELSRIEAGLRASLRRASSGPKPGGKLGDFFP